MAVKTEGAQGHTESVTKEVPVVAEVKAGEVVPVAAAKAGEVVGEVKAGEVTPVIEQPAVVVGGAPEKYALNIPDDAKDFVDTDTLKSVEAMARKAGWTNDEAQAAVAEHGLLVRQANDAFLVQLKSDPDYGGDKLVETQLLAKSAIDLLRPEGHPRREAFLRAVNRVAAGNNPEFVSFLADLGRRAGEDRVGSLSSGAAAAKKTTEEKLYGDSAKK